MRIGIATVQVPFVRGGAEALADSLKRELVAAGHEAEIITVPFKWYPSDRILQHMLACRLLDLTESSGIPIDRLIALKFPAYLVQHPNKVLWLLHQHRGAYDTWGTPFGDLQNDARGREIRAAITDADRRMIPEAGRIYTLSRNVSDRLQHFCQIPSEPIYHPPPHAERFYCDGAADYILFPSRINSSKRQDLVLQALDQVRSPVKIVFLGRPDNHEFGERLRAISENDDRLRDRVTWLGGVGDEEKYALYARSLAVLFPPSDEDYGYVTLEAMLAHKAVITCTDSGGPLEFVVHRETGFVCAPDPRSLAETLDHVWQHRDTVATMGQRGRERYDALGISWQRLITALTS